MTMEEIVADEEHEEEIARAILKHLEGLSIHQAIRILRKCDKKLYDAIYSFRHSGDDSTLCG